MRDQVVSTRETWAPPTSARLRPATQPLELLASGDGIVDRYLGSSAAAQSVRDMLRRIAKSEGSLLVHGASGTGKELIARIAHDLSARSHGPFIAVDCGALSEGVLESELFGHARGAFTGAAAERRGLFEEAAGGTLFLDEIANTSLQFQARLLRVLQEREVRRVGDNRARAIDVRIVAASNRDLELEAEGGRFREDLLYRLDVLSLRLPSLIDRRDDIPVLGRSILKTLGDRAGIWYECTEAAMALLVAWSWPGNVRELRNVLERAAAFAIDGVIDVDVLPDRMTRGVQAPARAERQSLQSLIDAFEKVVLNERLLANAWNRTLTASEFGITRRCLFNKVRRHGLQPEA